VLYHATGTAMYPDAVPRVEDLIVFSWFVKNQKVFKLPLPVFFFSENKSPRLFEIRVVDSGSVSYQAQLKNLTLAKSNGCKYRKEATIIVDIIAFTEIHQGDKIEFFSVSPSSSTDFPLR